MKRILLVAALLSFAMTAGAQDKSIQFAEEKFGEFHEVMHPAWHQAYPAKDYAALIASGPKFEATYAPIAKLEPAIKNAARLASFNSFRKEMGQQVALFTAACRASDSTKVYEILPTMHTAFEEAMAQLGPMDFKPLDGMLVTVDVILDMHIPAENWDGMAGSTETLLMKFDHITDSSFTPETETVKAVMKTEFGKGRATAEQMKACADKKDMACFRTQTMELKKALVAIRENYL